MKYILLFILGYFLYQFINPLLKGFKRDNIPDSNNTKVDSGDSVNIREEDIQDADFEELDE